MGRALGPDNENEITERMSRDGEEITSSAGNKKFENETPGVGGGSTPSVKNVVELEEGESLGTRGANVNGGVGIVFAGWDNSGD